MPDLSIVVPTYQRRTDLSRALRAIDRAGRDVAGGVDVDVVVVIDGSTDGSESIAAAELTHVPFRQVHQANRGLAAARNAGAAVATGRRLWFIDDDMIVNPQAITAHARWDESDPDGATLSGPCWMTADSRSVSLIVDWHENEYRRLAAAGRVLDPMACHFANTSMPTDLFRELNGFDASIASYGGEDNELAIRLLDAGHAIAFREDAAVHHRRARTAVSELRNTRLAMANQVRIARAHPHRYDEIFPGYGEDHRFARAIDVLDRLGVHDQGRGAIVLDRVIRAALRMERVLPRRLVNTLVRVGQRAAQTAGAVDAGADAETITRITGLPKRETS